MAKFIVIDGLDGCGKATQVANIKKRLEAEGKRVITISFPNYESDSSAAVKMYLGGELGKDATKLNPYMCSSFYAVDRFIQYTKEFQKYFEEDNNTIILADRYISANIIHQGGKIKGIMNRTAFAKWCYEYECKLCGMPKEDMTIVLTLKPEISQKLMTKRYNGNESKKDIHEANVAYLQQCYDAVNFYFETINKNRLAFWYVLDCEKNGGIAPIEEITDKLMENIHSVIK